MMEELGQSQRTMNHGTSRTDSIRGDMTIDISKLMPERKEATEADACCCTQGVRKFNEFTWRNKDRLLATDYINAAPCVSAYSLAVMRVLIAVVLLGQSVWIICATIGTSSFVFMSQWNLFAVTVFYFVIAVVQVRHSRRLRGYQMNIGVGKSFVSDGSDEARETLAVDNRATVSRMTL